MSPAQKAWNADVARINAAFEKVGAVVVYEDGFVGIDQARVPAGLARAYQGLTQMGYANGWI